jgi:hypothetical protein
MEDGSTRTNDIVLPRLAQNYLTDKIVWSMTPEVSTKFPFAMAAEEDVYPLKVSEDPFAMNP